METIRRVVLPSSYCLLSTSAQIHAAFLPYHLGKISVSSKTHLLLVKACPFAYLREICSSNSQPFSDASVSHLSRWSFSLGALVCSYFSIIKALPWHLSLFHCFQCPCACSLWPTGSWMYCLCSTCSFNLCFIWSVVLYFPCLLSFLFLNWPE